MKRLHLAATIGIAVSVVSGGVWLGCCKKDDPGPIAAPSSSEPPAPPPPTASVIPPVEDASDESDASGDADAKKPSGAAYDATRMKACCAALQANAASMPVPQNMYAAAAAQYCLAGVASLSSPAQKDQLIAGIRNALRGASLPAACH